MKKQFTFGLTVLALSLAVQTLGVYALPKMHIDENKYDLSNEILEENYRVLIPARDVFEKLGYSLEWENKNLIIKNDNNVIKLEMGSNFAYLNNSKIALSTAPKIIKNTAYVPLNLVELAIDKKTQVQWSKTDQILNINTVNKDENINISNLETIQYENDLLIDQAIEKATKRNSQLKSLNATLNLIEKERDRLNKNFGNLVTNPPNNSTYYPDSIRENSSTVRSLNKTLEDLPYNKEIQEDSIKLIIYNSFKTINESQNDIALLDKTIALKKQSFDQLTISKNLGMTSDYTLENAKLELDSLNDQKSMLEQGLEIEFVTLNHLIGNDPDSRYNVTFEYEYEPLEDQKLEGYIASRKASDPLVKLAENEVSLAQYNLNIYGMTAGSYMESYESKQNTLAEANRKLTDAKDSVEKKIRTTYGSIKQLETNIVNNSISITQAKKDYEVTLAKYNTGGATKLQLDMAELNILNAENSLIKNQNNHFLLVYRFNRPHLIQ